MTSFITETKRKVNVCVDKSHHNNVVNFHCVQEVPADTVKQSDLEGNRER